MGENSVVTEIKEYIEAHYGEQIRLHKLAKEVSHSQPYLCALFRRETGMSISGYLRKVRMHRAAELLNSRKDLGVQDVAEICGFRTASYFTFRFREYYQVPPTEYRKMVQQADLRTIDRSDTIFGVATVWEGKKMSEKKEIKEMKKDVKAEVKAEVGKEVKKAAEETKKVTKKAAEETKKVTKKAAEETKKVTKKAAAGTKKATKTAKSTATKIGKQVAEFLTPDKTTVYIQYLGREFDTREIFAKVKQNYIDAGSPDGAVKNMDLYVKPEDNAAYYVINGAYTGSVEL